ncbi:hypothetical protein GCM10027615_60490 [Plantactinospora veratri]
MVAGLVITMGTLGDRIGRRRLLMIGGAAFAVLSVVGARRVGGVDVGDRELAAGPSGRMVRWWDCLRKGGVVTLRTWY